MHFRSAAFADLDPRTLYELLRLRVDVFVVEQACAYPELDGRDTEPSARHHWVEEDGRVLGTLRVLSEPGGETRIGRVATSAQARRRGVAAELIRVVLAEVSRPVVIDAQAHLVGWYARFGFARSGEDFLEDGIPHSPMRLA